MMLEAQKY